MKPFRITSLVFFLLITNLYPQELSLRIAEAMDFFNRQDYGNAYFKLKEISADGAESKSQLASVDFYSAECLIALEQIDGAAAELEDFVATHIESNFRDKALYRLGTIYFQVGRFEECRSTLQILLEDYPGSDYAGSSYYWIGEAFVREGMLTEAGEFLKGSLESEKNNKFIDYSLFSLASVCERNGDFGEAVKYYDELLAYHFDSRLAPYAQLRIGLCFYKLKEFDRAVLELSDALVKQLPEDLYNESQYVLANTFFQLKEYKSAQESYEKVLSGLNDERTGEEIQYSLAWVSFQTRDYDEAYRIFSGLSKTASEPVKMNSLFWSAEALRYAAKTSGALEIYIEFVKSYPQSNLISKANLNTAILFFNQADYEQASLYLTSSISETDKSTSGRAYTLLGEINLAEEEYSVAKEHFQKALKISSLAIELENRAKLGLAVADYYLSDYDETISVLSGLSAEQKRFEKDKVCFYLAEAYFAKGEFSDALNNYNKISFADPDLTRQTLYGKAYSYFNLQDFPNASFYFEEFVEKYGRDKNLVDAKMRLADSYYGIKEYQRASDIYTEVFNKYRGLVNNPYSYYQYAQTLYRASQPASAIDKFKDLQNKFPRSDYADDSQYLIGWINFQQGNYRMAIKEYRMIFENYNNSALVPVAYYSIGDAFYNMAEYDSSLVNYKKLIEKYPGTKFVFDAVNGIQYCYMAKDEPGKAVELIDEFLTVNKSSDYADRVLLKKGEIYYSLANYELAAASYTEFINLFPGSAYAAEAFYWRAKSFINLDRQEEAIASLKTVVDSYLDSEIGLSAVIELGKLYSADKNFVAAIEVYEQSANKFSDPAKTAEILFEQAMARINNNEISEAYTNLNNISSYYTGTIFADKAKVELGLIELARQNFTGADDLFREIGEQRNDEIGARSQFYLGESLFTQAKFDDAISAFVRVRSVFPGYDEWYTRSLLRLGDCYIKLKEWKKAREMFRAVKKKHPNDDFGKEANKKLKTL